MQILQKIKSINVSDSFALSMTRFFDLQLTLSLQKDTDIEL
jgi:hypothetical protein